MKAHSPVRRIKVYDRVGLLSENDVVELDRVEPPLSNRSEVSVQTIRMSCTTALIAATVTHAKPRLHTP